MKISFILHTYSVGGAERRCVAIANYLASNGVDVRLVLLDLDKMYACRSGRDGLELVIRMVKAPPSGIPVNEKVELVYLLHPGETPIADSRFICIPYSDTDLPVHGAADLICETNEQAQSAKRHLEVLESIYVDRIYHYVRCHPDDRIVSWMTFCNIATAVAMNDLPNDFAIVECTSPQVEFPEGSAYRYLKSALYPRANAAFFQTEEIESYYSFLTDTSRYVIPNPVEASLPSRYSGHRQKCIVNFCRIEKPKNLNLLIDAFVMLRRSHPDYILYLIGDGSEKPALQQRVRTLECEKSILFSGFDSNVHRSVRDAAMFVSSSCREGMSNSMLEAMAIGLPVVCTDCSGGGARSVIKNGENGLLVPADDPVALCNAMKRIIETDGLSKRLSENAEKIRFTHSINIIGEKWRNALSEPW